MIFFSDFIQFFGLCNLIYGQDHGIDPGTPKIQQEYYYSIMMIAMAIENANTDIERNPMAYYLIIGC
jgi:hypothetical protein